MVIFAQAAVPQHEKRDRGGLVAFRYVRRPITRVACSLAYRI